MIHSCTCPYHRGEEVTKDEAKAVDPVALRQRTLAILNVCSYVVTLTPNKIDDAAVLALTAAVKDDATWEAIVAVLNKE